MYNFHFTLKTKGNDIQMDQDRIDPWFEDFLADRVDGSYNDIYFSEGIALIERRDLKTGEVVTINTPKELADLYRRTIDELECRKRELDESISLLNGYIKDLDKK